MRDYEKIWRELLRSLGHDSENVLLTINTRLTIMEIIKRMHYLMEGDK